VDQQEVYMQVECLLLVQVELDNLMEEMAVTQQPLLEHLAQQRLFIILVKEIVLQQMDQLVQVQEIKILIGEE
jgi:hypothetical protein